MKAETIYSVQIFGVDSPHYKLKHPVVVTVEDDGFGRYIARLLDIQQYGVGKTEYGALSELKKAMVKFYEKFRWQEMTEEPLVFHVRAIRELIVPLRFETQDGTL